jgi:hypothetical protein
MAAALCTATAVCAVAASFPPFPPPLIISPTEIIMALAKIYTQY